MSNRVARIAPALIATLLASLVAAAPALHAEPTVAAAPALHAEPTAAAGDDCLARPSGPSPQGQHWYYRIDRASNNRKCWYLRDIDAKTGEPAQTRAAPAAQPAMAAPAAQPTMAAPAKPPADTSSNPPALTDTDAGLVPPTTSPPAATAPWPSAPPAEPMRESPADQPAISPKFDVREHDVRTVKRSRPTAVERPLPAERSVVEQSNHMPALLGAAVVLALIVIGSLAARLIFQYVRFRHVPRPRRNVARDLPISMDSPLPRMSESPSIALRRPDITRVAIAPRERRADRRDDPAHDRAERAPDDDRAAATQPETAAVIEDSVRSLLQRLRTELQLRPMTDGGAQRPPARDRRI